MYITSLFKFPSPRHFDSCSILTLPLYNILVISPLTPRLDNPLHCARSIFIYFDKILQDAQDLYSPTAQDLCSSPLRKIYVPPLRISMSPQLRKIHVSPLKHAYYILKSIEADHWKILPIGKGKPRKKNIYYWTKYEDVNSY